ncbi:MAG TPA: hypothetical protein PKZ64_18260 [Spirochaetota bacterium]|nr:hypothetical protein [Spirochaetota bacterium]
MKYTVTTTEATKQYNTAVKFFNNSFGSRRLNFSPFHKEIKQWAKHQGYSAKLYLRSAAIECINPGVLKEPECLMMDVIQVIANGQAYLIVVNIFGPSYDNNLHYILEEHAKERKAIYVKAECLDDVICEIQDNEHNHKGLPCVPDIKSRRSFQGDYSILFSPENLTWKTARYERA